MEEVVRRILSDIRVEYKEEFDKNFQRQGFFNTAWQRRKSPLRPGGATLIDASHLRDTVNVEIIGNTIRFVYGASYAAIHNEGGEITVTAKMKKFFWKKYILTVGRFGRKKNGGIRKDKRTVQLSSEAEFWKFMALKKVGSKIVIPRRQFVGTSPEVENTVKEIISKNLNEYFENEYKIDSYAK
jgi:phage gpG-like protein